MNSIKLILATLIFFNIEVSAQIPPTPPSTTQSENRTITYSVTDHDCENCSSSISISNSDNRYDLKAKFHESKMEQLKAFLISEMGENNINVVKGNLNWSLSSDDDQVYLISLSNKRLSIEMDKELASMSLLEKIEYIGDSVSHIIAGASKHEADEMRREADEMQREAERMSEEAKRMSEESKRLYSLAREDADRLREEAEIIKEHAEAMKLEAKHRGGISDDIRLLLDKESTILSPNNSGNNVWKWPVLQEILIEKLLKDKLVENENDITYFMDFSGVFVNSLEVKDNLQASYRGIFKKYYPKQNDEIRFVKQNNHILLINSNAEIIEFFEDLKSTGLMNKSNRASLNINGYNVLLDNEVMPENDYVKIMNLLKKHNIMAAPGKILVMENKGTYKLGYSIDNRSHFGTWIEIN